MHLLLAALLEGQQTHSETVNEVGVAGEVEEAVRSSYKMCCDWSMDF